MNDDHTHTTSRCHGAPAMFYIGSFPPITMQHRQIAHNGEVWLMGHICEACKRVCEVIYERQT